MPTQADYCMLVQPYLPLLPSGPGGVWQRVRHTDPQGVGIAKRNGAPKRIRTSGLKNRNLALYPTELWALYLNNVAEREGFEPSVELMALHTISNRAPSASSDTSPKSKRNNSTNQNFCQNV